MQEAGAGEGEGTMKNETTVERTSDRELVVTRMFNGPAHIVFDAWTKPELLKRWWAPKSLGVSLFECESDLRVGGTYRYAFGRDPKEPEVFSGRYIEVNPPSRLVLTQVYERMRRAGEAIVTATFEERQVGRVSPCTSCSPARKRWTALSPPGWSTECARLSISSRR
jgi:uncharacterized protein YndB with AHSA1/START domain